MSKILEIDDLKKLAKRKVPRMFYDYVDSGSWTETTYSANEEDFKKVKNLEQNETFYEGVLDYKTGKRKTFFNLGPSNDWRRLLDGKIKIKLEKAFEKEMIELGYL